MAEVAPPGAAEAGVNNSSTFYGDPVAFLQFVASCPPSLESLQQLAGSVAATISSRRNVTSEVAVLYLQAAARQLTCRVHAPPHAILQPFALGGAPSFTVPSYPGPNRPDSVTWTVSGESKAAINQILDAVGNAVTCVSPRSLILQSGILPVLASMLPSTGGPTANANPSLDVTPLTVSQVEFLQACLYAQQYQYAESLIAHTWPRPTSAERVTARTVLRYYYVRGTVHVGCDNWTMARRCFWTCLSIPSENVSAIAIAAWKKLVLVQCRCSPYVDPLSKHTSVSTTPLGLPKTVPLCVHRYITSAVSATSTPTSSTSYSHIAPRADDPEEMHMVESSDNEGPRQGGSGGKDKYPSLGVKAYTDLVQAFIRRDPIAFLELTNEHETLFSRDGNMGLVRQCHSQLLRHRVCLHSRMYSSVSLEDLSTFLQLSLDQVGRIVQSLSTELSWAAEIVDGIVHFPKLPLAVPRNHQDRVGNTYQNDEILQLTTMMQKIDGLKAPTSKTAKKGTHIATLWSGEVGPTFPTAAAEAKGVEEV